MVGVAPLAGAGAVGPKRIRPRPLDIYKSITIVRDCGGNDADETKNTTNGTSDSSKAVSTKETGGPASDTTATDAASTRPVYNIPAPIVSEQDKTHFDEQVSREFVTPSAYIRFPHERPDEWEATNSQLNIDILSNNIDINNKRRSVPGSLSGKATSITQAILGIGGHIPPENQVDYELTLNDITWLEKTAKYGPAHFPKDKPGILTQDMLERMLDLLEKATARNIPIKQSEAVQLFALRLGVVQTPSYRVSEDVYQHWMYLRMRTKKPLLRRFWPATAPDDNSSHMTFRPREKERYKLRKKRENNLESYEKLMQVKRDFETVRQMLELVKRREALRRVDALLVEDEFKLTLHQLLSKTDNNSKQTTQASAPTQPFQRLVQSLDDLPGALELVSESAQLVVPRMTNADETVDTDAAKAKRIEAQLAELKGRTKKLSKKRQRDESRKNATALKLAIGGDVGSGATAANAGINLAASVAAAGVKVKKDPSTKRRRIGSISLTQTGTLKKDTTSTDISLTGATEGTAIAVDAAAAGADVVNDADGAAGAATDALSPKPMALPSFLLPLGTFADGFLNSSVASSGGASATSHLRARNLNSFDSSATKPQRVLRELSTLQPQYCSASAAASNATELNRNRMHDIPGRARAPSSASTLSLSSAGKIFHTASETRKTGNGRGRVRGMATQSSQRLQGAQQREGERGVGYRCRGRMGRGGRLLIDRVRVRTGLEDSTRSGSGSAEASNCYTSACGNPTILVEQYLSSAQLAACGGGPKSSPYLDLSKGVDPRLNQHRQQNVIMPDGKTIETGKKMSASTMDKILTLYAQSDSEDEEVATLDDPLANSVFEFTHKPNLQFLC